MTWLSIVGLAAAISYTAVTVYKAKHPPTVIHSAKFRQSHARPGDEVELIVDRTRNKWCHGVVFEYWVNPLTGAIEQGEIVPAGPYKDRTGRFTTPFQKHVPKELRPGKWCYQPHIKYDCGNAAPFILQQPLACLNIIN